LPTPLRLPGVAAEALAPVPRRNSASCATTRREAKALADWPEAAGGSRRLALVRYSLPQNGACALQAPVLAKAKTCSNLEH
jgi:hypothetical protein